MSNRKKLSSWKEIASYLEIEVRTAQRWEKKFGLPVFRIDEASKSYVFAYVDEIDQWLMEKERKDKFSKTHLFKNKKFLYGTIPLTLLVLIVLFYFLSGWMNSTPSDFRINETQIEIYNNRGKKLWDYDCDALLDARYYSLAPKYANISSAKPTCVFFEDIDKDTRLNVIVAVETVNNIKEEVICFDQKGRELWSCRAGREIKYGDYQYSSDFDIRLVRLTDLDNDGFLETIIIANHKMFFPSRLLILDHEGKMEGEYWNSGHLMCVEFSDLNNDGFKEILLGGVNNQYMKACLVVLDPRKIEGASPQGKESRYYSGELNPGTEKYYLLIPQDEVGKFLNRYDAVAYADLIGNHRILISTKFSRAFYEFDYQLKPTYLHFGDEFSSKYKQLEKEGRINSPQHTIDKDKLLSEIVYWDGKDWTQTPTMTEHWKKMIRAEIMSKKGVD
jgi:hypothetical protein